MVFFMAKPDAPLRVLAPAKLNLTLAVLGHRLDGFHEIESWVVKVDWSDELTFAPASTLSMSIHGDVTGLAADESNLVLRAARALADESGHAATAAITLEKKIPLGAGLGGGSSDAAATLRGLSELWALNWPDDRLLAIAQRIGSDVPLFVEKAPGLVIRGRGERLEPVPASLKGWAAIIVPGYSILTASVYGALTGDRPGDRAPIKLWLESGRTLFELQMLLFNDLEPAALTCEPRLGTLLKTLDARNGRRVHMTGSGSCLFALFDGREEADRWRDDARKLVHEPTRIEVVRLL